jgi:hypothetical protein
MVSFKVCLCLAAIKVELAGIAHSGKELKLYMPLAQDNLRDKNQYDKIKRFVRRLEVLRTAIIEIAGQEYMGVSKNPNARPCRVFCGISASENLSVLALRTHCIFFFELPQNLRQLRTL